MNRITTVSVFLALLIISANVKAQQIVESSAKSKISVLDFIILRYRILPHIKDGVLLLGGCQQGQKQESPD